MTKSRVKNRIIASLLVVVMCFLVFQLDRTLVQAAPKTLNIATARALALADSDDYDEVKNEIALAQSQYTQAVKKIKLKQINQRTFRWTPLLSFKFPESPTEQDSFEYTYKELELQSKIDSLGHKLNDTIFKVYEKVEQQFIKVYVLQEKIKYTNNQIALAENTLAKNKLRLATGDASEKDIEKMEKKLEKLQNQLTTQERNFSNEKQKLSGIIGLDISTSYVFTCPFVDAKLTRDDLEEIQDYTVDNDHSFHEVCVSTENSLIALDTNYSLMKKKYGGEIGPIESYITQIKRGQKVKVAAFKKTYNEVIKQIDSHWNGRKKILFFKFPKIWFKGSRDGVRYIEDSPMVLYENAIDYQGQYQAKIKAEKELRDSVKDNYNTFISFKATKDSTLESIARTETKISEGTLKNQMGEMTYEEFEALLDENDELQIQLLDTCASISEILYTMNRQSCGFLNKRLRKIKVTLSNNGTGGLSLRPEDDGEAEEDDNVFSSDDLIVESSGEGIYYYIHQLASDTKFEVGITTSANCPIAVTDYEFWINNTQIGARTDKRTSIKHLALDLKMTDKCFIRLYNGSEFIDDCQIDPAVFSDKLTVTTGYSFSKAEDNIVGSFFIDKDSNLPTCKLTVKPGSNYTNIKGFNLENLEGSKLSDGAIVKIDEGFTYLSVLENSLLETKINFYDETNNLLFQAGFNTNDSTIIKIEN